MRPRLRTKCLADVAPAAPHNGATTSVVDNAPAAGSPGARMTAPGVRRSSISDDGEATDAIEGGSINIHSSNAKAATGNSDEEIASIPAKYELVQNYPNPFNPSTRITFALPETGEIQLTIYNTSGQLVRTLVAGQKTAGAHTVVWDASDDNGAHVASGVYLYVLKAGKFTAQRKLILMK